jgi:hypothetical protein
MTDLLQSLVTYSLPPILERERYTFKTSPLVLVATLPLILASYIRLRHPKAPFLFKLIVLLAGLPIVSHFLLKRYFVVASYDSEDGIPYSVNYIQFVCGMAIGVIDLKFIELLFMEKDSDFEVKGWEEYSREEGNGKANGGRIRQNSRYTVQRPAIFPGSIIPLEVDSIMTIRGQGYNWGPKESKGGYKAIMESKRLAKGPAEEASKYKWTQVRRIALAALINLALMDFCDSLIKNRNIFPAAGRHGGGPLSEAANGILGAPLGPLVVTFATGVLTFVGLQSSYAVGYTLHLLITPASQIPIVMGKWEPLPFNRPYAATSLADFWSKHWHIFVRRTFTVFAYKPVLRISKRIGLNKQFGQLLALIATFAISGLLHEGCLEGQVSYYYDRRLHRQHGHLDLRKASLETTRNFGFGAKSFATTYAFTIQAFFLVFESFWLDTIEPKLVGYVTSRKVGKIVDGRKRKLFGWLFTYSCMMYSGSHIVDVSPVLTLLLSTIKLTI